MGIGEVTPENIVGLMLASENHWDHDVTGTILKKYEDRL